MSIFSNKVSDVQKQNDNYYRTSGYGLVVPTLDVLQKELKENPWFLSITNASPTDVQIGFDNLQKLRDDGKTGYSVLIPDYGSSRETRTVVNPKGYKPFEGNSSGKGASLNPEEDIYYELNYNTHISPSVVGYYSLTKEGKSNQATNGTTEMSHQVNNFVGDINFGNLEFAERAKNDEINPNLLRDLSRFGKRIYIGTADTGHSDNTTSGLPSRHKIGVGVDITKIDGYATNAEKNGKANARGAQLADELAEYLQNLGYVRNVESGNDKAVLWKTNTGGNHFNHLHVSNRIRPTGSTHSDKALQSTVANMTWNGLANVDIDAKGKKTPTKDNGKGPSQNAIRAGTSAMTPGQVTNLMNGAIGGIGL